MEGNHPCILNASHFTLGMQAVSKRVASSGLLEHSGEWSSFNTSVTKEIAATTNNSEACRYVKETISAGWRKKTVQQKIRREIREGWSVTGSPEMILLILIFAWRHRQREVT